MIEGIVQPGHLRELDRTVEISRQPPFLEVRDMTNVPDDWAHQRIVLSMQVLVRQARDEQQCPLARFVKKTRDLLLRSCRSQWCWDCGDVHWTRRAHRKSWNDTAGA